LGRPSALACPPVMSSPAVDGITEQRSPHRRRASLSSAVNRISALSWQFESEKKLPNHVKLGRLRLHAVVEVCTFGASDGNL
jgi:hypothetical protein